MSKIPLLLKNMLPENLERQLRDFRDLYLRQYRIEKLPTEIFSPDLYHYRISFCITCMNRFFHLKKTILKNITDNLSYPNLEFVVINYNSADGLHEWAKSNLIKYIKMGLVNYYYTPDPKFFHASKAKNSAHTIASGEVVCNLDGDNFTGRDFAYYINYLVNRYGVNTLYHFRKSPFWGTEGRIAIAKEKFISLGGYDERLLPTGHEDYDFINRAKAFGLQYKLTEIENFLHYLSNTTKEKSKNFQDPNAQYYEYESANRTTSESNIAANRLVANQGIKWGSIPLYKNFTDKLVQF